jgi:hypothetical protein
MFKLYSFLTSLFYTIFDWSFLHNLIYIAGSSGYIVADYITMLPKINAFKRLRKVATVFRRQ